MDKRKRKAVIITIALFILGITLNFLFVIMPDEDFKNTIDDFSNSIDLSYLQFWIICTSIIIVVTLFFVWRQALNENGDEPTKMPNELTSLSPLNPEFFIGRDKELKKLRKKIIKGKKFILLVNGHGGIGKTTLAARYYHTYKNKYKHISWLTNEISITNALLSLGYKLGLSPEERKLPSKEQLNLILTKLSNLEEPSLLVIDNVNETKDLEENYLALKRCKNFHVLLTTRITEFNDEPVFKVEGLPEPYAFQLFKKHYPIHNPDEDDLLRQIMERVEYNTLIIELFAKNLRGENRLEHRYSLQQLADDIHSNLVQLSKNRQIQTEYHTDGIKLRTEKPDDIVMAMYDFGKLTDSEKRMISVFTVLPNEAISFDFLKQSFPDEDIQEPLLSIAQKGWVDFNEKEKQFKVNQVIQDVAAIKQKKRLFADVKPIINKLSNHLAGDDILHHEQFLFTQRMIRYAASILNKISDKTEETAVLCQSLGDYHSNTGELTLALTVYQKMFSIFKTLHKINTDSKNFKNGLAISYSNLGETHSALGNLDKALKYFEERSQLGKELYEAYPQNVAFKNGLAISYSKLGETHSALGNLDKALKYFEKDTELTKELYEAYPQNVAFKNNLAISYAKLAVFKRDMLKDTKKAREYFQKAHSLWMELVKQSSQSKEIQTYYTQVKRDINDLD